jgi:hypothetical protein
MSSRPDTFVSLLSPFLAKLRRRFTFSPFKNPGCTLPVNLQGFRTECLQGLSQILVPVVMGLTAGTGLLLILGE